MKMFWERTYLDLVKNRKKGVIPTLIKAFLFLLSLPYRLVIAIRNWAYDHGWFKQYTPPIPVVISVGNLTVGGTGKTPITLKLAQSLGEEVSIAILSRGYRSHASKLSTPIAVSTGKGPMHSAAYCGDEPFLLASNLPTAHIFVGSDRHQASNMAAKAGAEVILLDDGMQHRKLARDFDVVVLDARDPFGQNHLLPRGLLRESVKSLSRADLIVLNRIESATFETLKIQLAEYTQAPIVGTEVKVSQIYDLEGNPIDTIHNQKVGLFCGLANPEYFRETVTGLGAHCAAEQFFPDHAPYNHGKLARFAEKSKSLGASLLICSEKDKVKLQDLPELPLPIVWVKMELAIVEGAPNWEAFIDEAKETLARRRQGN